MKWKKENNVAKLTGPGGDDDAHRGDSPGGAADSGVASGDECPTGARDPHHDHQLLDNENSARCSAPFNSMCSRARWVAFPGLPDI